MTKYEKKDIFYNCDGIGFLNYKLFYTKKNLKKTHKINTFKRYETNNKKINKYEIFYNSDGIGFIN